MFDFPYKNSWVLLTSSFVETNIAPARLRHPKRKLVFQPSIFRCDLLVSGRPYLQILFFSTVILVFWGGRCGELGFQEIPVKSSICWLRVCFAKNMGVINFGVRDGIGVIVSPTQTKYSISSGKSLKFYYTFEHQLWIPPPPPKKKNWFPFHDPLFLWFPGVVPKNNSSNDIQRSSSHHPTLRDATTPVTANI